MDREEYTAEDIDNVLGDEGQGSDCHLESPCCIIEET
jgi:hypothetical protein